MVTVHSRELKEVHRVQGTSSDEERKIVSLLKILGESSEPMGSITITRDLDRYGIFLRESS